MNNSQTKGSGTAHGFLFNRHTRGENEVWGKLESFVTISETVCIGATSQESPRVEFAPRGVGWVGESEWNRANRKESEKRWVCPQSNREINNSLNNIGNPLYQT